MSRSGVQFILRALINTINVVVNAEVIMKKTQYKTIWISDIHLGSRGCKHDYLLSFLKQTECQKLYLLGDIIDGWRMTAGKTYWPQEHVNIIRRFLTMSKRGTDVIYVTGNHDEFLRKYTKFKLNIGNIRIVNSVVHESVTGKKYWCLHGDTFDNLGKKNKIIAKIGDKAYNVIISVNNKINKYRQKRGKPYLNISAYMKHKAKAVVNFIVGFEHNITSEAKRRGYDGVMCGHIHHLAMKEVNDIMYFNTADWVESCCAIVEHFDGKIEAIFWGNGTSPETVFELMPDGTLITHKSASSQL